MRYKFAFLILGSMLLLSSCGTSRKVVSREKPLAIAISENAREFLGTAYSYGGTSKAGMDCSGLIYTAFLQENIELPRISREMSLLGKRLYLREVGIGDLLFFETDKNKKVINHVGLVVETREEEIFFIHSSSSQGVIISSLKNPYWEEHFVMARRVL